MGVRRLITDNRKDLVDRAVGRFDGLSMLFRLRAVRTALGMPGAQLAGRQHVSGAGRAVRQGDDRDGTGHGRDHGLLARPRRGAQTACWDTIGRHTLEKGRRSGSSRYTWRSRVNPEHRERLSPGISRVAAETLQRGPCPIREATNSQNMPKTDPSFSVRSGNSRLNAPARGNCCGTKEGKWPKQWISRAGKRFPGLAIALRSMWTVK